MTQHWTPRQALGRALEVLRGQGARSLGIKVVREAGFSWLLVIEKRLADPIPTRLIPLPLSVELLRREECAELQALRPEIPLERFLARHERGDLCFVTRKEGEIINAMWLACRIATVEPFGLELELGPKQGYFYDAFTPQDWRGKNIPAMRAPLLYARCRDEGLQTLLGIVEPDNHASIRTYEKMGWRSIGYLFLLGFGNRRIHYYHPKDGGKVIWRRLRNTSLELS